MALFGELGIFLNLCRYTSPFQFRMVLYKRLNLIFLFLRFIFILANMQIPWDGPFTSFLFHCAFMHKTSTTGKGKSYHLYLLMFPMSYVNKKACGYLWQVRLSKQLNTNLAAHSLFLWAREENGMRKLMGQCKVNTDWTCRKLTLFAIKIKMNY